MVGIRAGDRLLALDGLRIRDIIDYRFFSDAPELLVRLGRDGEEAELRVTKGWDEDLGVELDSAVFDGVRRCRNNCSFCFVKNLPRGLRKTLYIKDDDYRLSFLYGNFVTLSNVTDDDLDRIEEQRLSPLYISVHATERGLRNRLMGVETPDILEQIDELRRRRIAVNAQVVLCPGMNDGVHLDRTIDDLAARHSVVNSVAVVPVGLTRFYRGGDIRPYTPAEAAIVVEQVRARQRAFRRTLGRSFVHLGDEFYMMTGREVPSSASYDGYPQLENGVGLVRRLLSAWAARRRRLPARVDHPRRVGWICGTSAYSTLRRFAADINGIEGMTVELFPVVNRFFGSTVTVAGLLTGTDVIPVLRDEKVDQWILPRAMFDSSGGRTLDDVALDEIRSRASAPVAVAEAAVELMEVSLYGSEECAA